MKGWNFFDDGSPYLGHPLLTAERTALEVDHVLRWTSAADQPVRSVLDVGCGFGRHCVELARRGLTVVGVDPSEAMIDAARSLALEASVEVDFRVGVADAVVRADDRFDLAICLFTSLGQISDSSLDPMQGARETLAAIARVLTPGGAAVLELPDPERTAASLIETETLGETSVTRSLNGELHTVIEAFETPAGVFKLAYRLFTESELTALLTDAGLVVERVQDSGIIEPPLHLTTIVARSTSGP